MAKSLRPTSGLSDDAKRLLADAIADYEERVKEMDDAERERWGPALAEVILEFDL